MRVFGVGLICTKVALVPLLFDYSLDWPFTVAKGLLSHALAYPLAGILVALAIRRGRQFLSYSPLHVAVLAFLGANVAATVTAADSVLALYGAHGRMLGLGTIADWVVLYFGAALLVRTRSDWMAVFSAAVTASIMVLGYEAIQLLGLDPLSWNMDSSARPFSTIGQPTTLGLYLSTLALGTLALGLLLQGLTRPWRALLLAFTVVLLVGAVATGSRASVVGIATGSATLVLFLWFTRSGNRARVITIGGAGAGMMVITLLVLATPLGTRLATTIEGSIVNDSDPEALVRLEPSATGRIELYGIALQMLRDRPIFGYGPDNFAVGVPKFRAEQAGFVRQGLATSGHSWLSYVATGSGGVGLASFFSIIGIAVFLAARNCVRPIPPTATVMLAAFLGTGLTTISDVGTDWLFWVAVGAVAASSSRLSSSDGAGAANAAYRKTRGGGGQLRNMNVVAFACLAISLLALPSTASALDASRATRESQNARLTGKTQQAIDLGLRATRLDPGRAEYWHDLGLAYVGDARWQDASTAFERASRLAPYDQRHVGDFARAQLALALKGDPTARSKALELGDLAVRIDPNNPLSHLTRAVVMQATVNVSEALRSVRRALDLDPQSRNASLYTTAVQVTAASGQAREALAVARQGIGILGRSVQSVALRVELARVLVTLGQANDALSELDTALAIHPGHVAATRLQAEIRAGSGR